MIGLVAKGFKLHPMLMVELLLVALAIGVGSSFAMSVNPLSTTQYPWAGQTTITQAPNLAVTNWDLVYSTNLANVTTLRVEVTNSDGSAQHNGTLRIALGSDTPTTLAWGSKPTGDIAASGSTVISFNLDVEANATSDPDVADVDWLNILVEEAQ